MPATGDGHHISIGRFAGMTGISANTLRRYDELGLLSPAITDPDTSYRRYAIEQLDTGVLIRLLRDLDVPLDEIKALVTGGGPAQVRAVLSDHRERTVERRAELERILTRIDVALNEERGLLPYEVELIALSPVWVVTRRATVPRPRIDDVIARSLDEMEAVLAAASTASIAREFVLYHNTLAWYQGVDMEVCLPVAEAVAATLGARRLPGGDAMQTVYRGPWDDIWQAYATMLARIARRGYEPAGPVRESYAVDDRDTDDPQRYVTELTWPVQPRGEAADSPPLDPA
jgi:DNA-binding transcriptional MerR regulator